jgi:hypothetical protein
MIRLLQFTIYYVRKRTSVLLGLHHTRNPLSIRWRWHYFVSHYNEIRIKLRQKEKPLLSKGKPDESY